MQNCNEEDGADGVQGWGSLGEVHLACLPSLRRISIFRVWIDRDSKLLRPLPLSLSLPDAKLRVLVADAQGLYPQWAKSKL